MSSWRTLLLRIGEKCPEYGGATDLKEHIETCYGVIWREFEHSKDDIFELLLQCAEQLPHKIPLYGVLVGLINLENEDFAKRVVDTTHSILQDAIYLGNCNRIRLLLRLLTGLMCSKVILPSSIVEVFETLLSSAAIIVDEEAGNPSWQSRADFYITCILSCLPWGGAELIEQVPDEFERVMVGVQSYLSIRRHSQDIGFTVFDSDEDKFLEEKDFVEDLWDRIQVLSNNGWKTDSVSRPHLSFEAQLVTGKSHSLSPISCPELPEPSTLLTAFSRGREKHQVQLKYPQRLRRLNIFSSEKAENMQPIDRFIVEEYLLDVLHFFNGCRKECASYMVGLPVPFRYEYLMAETIFSQAHKRTHDLETFTRSRTLIRVRYYCYHSHHLSQYTTRWLSSTFARSNFQCIWPWEEWAYVKDLPKWAPQRVFVQEVLEREVRLSYWDKIKQSIENAPALEQLLPPRGGPNFKYIIEDSQEGMEGHTLSKELNSMIRARKTAREITLWVEENIIPLHGFNVALEVVVQTFLDIGSKSFTHLITVLERYGQVIAKLCTDQDKQILLLEEVSSYWKNNTQMTAIAIDRMMGYRLISNLSIVRWVLSPSNINQFHTSDRPWEILRNSLNKTYNRVTDLRKEIQSLKKSVLLAEEATVKAMKEYEAAESKLDVVDDQPVQSEKPGRLKRLKGYVEKAKDDETSIQESLEAKEALLARALEENKALFFSLYKSFKDVLMERLPPVSADGKLPKLRTANVDSVTIDSEPSTMDVDHDDGKTDNSQSNGERVFHSYTTGEQEQWCLCTLGYVKAFSRQYASEIWPHIDTLDSEVFAGDVHPLFRNAAYAVSHFVLSKKKEKNIKSVSGEIRVYVLMQVVIPV
ncbi:nuclear cap-binding protein subunit 1-like isoform X2 [Phoenix dactylifera]|uniref:Nuclear cap-binding protein subunit 1-like isoform X2 n=1 Tax=Phoenix dactylifera TaxID=42345 RepID=A0A8B9AZ44_PHODC|nr:nuclear cap-binding protein subunit 1-like isoform X2 [Phoenix dactylifera]